MRTSRRPSQTATNTMNMSSSDFVILGTPAAQTVFLETLRAASGVAFYPGSGGDYTVSLLAKELPWNAFDPRNPKDGCLVLWAADYSRAHADYLSELAGEDFSRPDAYTALWRKRGASIRVDPDSVHEVAVVRPEPANGASLTVAVRMAEVIVSTPDQPDRHQQVFFSPVDAETLLRLLGHLQLDVSAVLLIKQGGFSAPFGDGEQLYTKVPRLVGRYLATAPHFFLADAQCPLPLAPEWTDCRFPGWGWEEVRVKGAREPGDGAHPGPATWIHPDLASESRGRGTAPRARERPARPPQGRPPVGLLHLLSTLPSLDEADGVRPWSARRLERWAHSPECTTQQQAAARFLFLVAGRHPRLLGKFDAIRDMLALDDVHRRAVEAWFVGQSLDLMGQLEKLRQEVPYGIV